MILPGRTEVKITAEDFVGFLGDFLVDAHIGTEDKPSSKTVAVFIPWNAEEKRKEDGERINIGDSKFILCEDKATYLGYTLTTDLCDDEHLRGRISRASQVFGALRQKLMADKKVWREVKRLAFEAMILPTLLDGVECCVMSQAIMAEMTTACHRMVRSSLRITSYTQRQYRLTSEALLDRLGLAPLHHYIDLKVLGYAGHVQRMQPFRLPKQMRDGTMIGTRRSGGQYKSHNQFLCECLTRKDMLDEWKELAVNKTEWRNRVKMVVDKRARATNTKKSNFINCWKTAPASVLGHHAEKKFEGKWYGGKVTSFDIDIDTNEIIWSVRYDDGEAEDYNALELAAVLCENFDALT